MEELTDHSKLMTDLPASSPNWENRTMWTGDNLDIMRGMNSESVDLIYLDPILNLNATVPIGGDFAKTPFKDTWKLDDINPAWHSEIKQAHPGLCDLLSATRIIRSDKMVDYLIYMSIRIIEMHRLLKSTGSIYLHCDPAASHYLKLLLDSVFGGGNFRNEIVWGYRSMNRATRNFPRRHDIILWYSKGSSWTYNPVRIPDTKPPVKFAMIPKKELPKKKIEQERIVEDWWSDIPMPNLAAKERTGYPTQKPLALVRRIVRASSYSGDMILDPFCGCATACIAAEAENRQWVGIDISPKAAELVKHRTQRDLGMVFEGHCRTDIPERTDL